MSTKISALPSRSSPQNTDLFVLADSDEGLNYKVSTQDLATKIGDILMPTYQKELDEVSSSTFYLGESTPGTLVSAASWRIQKVVSTGNDISIKFADNGNFSQVWNDRLVLVYS